MLWLPHCFPLGFRKKVAPQILRQLYIRMLFQVPLLVFIEELNILSRSTSICAYMNTIWEIADRRCMILEVRAFVGQEIFFFLNLNLLMQENHVSYWTHAQMWVMQLKCHCILRAIGDTHASWCACMRATICADYFIWINTPKWIVDIIVQLLLSHFQIQLPFGNRWKNNIINKHDDPLIPCFGLRWFCVEEKMLHF